MLIARKRKLALSLLKRRQVINWLGINMCLMWILWIFPIEILQVLVLKVAGKPDEHLILERKNGQHLDWSFYSLDNDVENVVKAHKSVVLKYSSYLRNICQLYADRDTPKNCRYQNMQWIQFIYWILIFILLNFSLSVSLSIENNRLPCDLIIWTFRHY